MYEIYTIFQRGIKEFFNIRYFYKLKSRCKEFNLIEFEKMNDAENYPGLLY